MIKRPLDRRFAEAVLNGEKFTTIRSSPWPCFVPIMLYHWKDQPYRSKHQDVAEIMVEEALEISISHSLDDPYSADSTVVFDRSYIDGKPIYQTEGFANWGEMQEWFSKVVPLGKTVTLSLMRFKLVEPIVPDYWASNGNRSSNTVHAYKAGHAICGSPLAANQQRWSTPGCIGCKKCRELTKS